MPNEDIKQRVIKVLADSAGRDNTDGIDLETAFAGEGNSLGFDSLDLVEAVMAVEEEFDIKIPDEEAEKIRSVGQAVAAVEAALANAG